MIRCVSFDYYICGRENHVAFLDTVTDRFIEISGEQAWDSAADLLEAFDNEPDCRYTPDRLLDLAPGWFRDNHEENF